MLAYEHQKSQKNFTFLYTLTSFVAGFVLALFLMHQGPISEGHELLSQANDVIDFCAEVIFDESKEAESYDYVASN